ncbi:hypothetical protein ACOSQ3_007455 [Xanthoceras sorbifolium]
MFTSTKWENCKWLRTAKGKAAYSTVLNMNFWNGVTLCLKVFAPLVKVLRLVNRDVKPSMSFLYEELKNAKEEIKVVLRNNIHTKKRNRLDVDRLNNLVFVQFNSKLMNKRKRLMDKEANIDVLLASNGDACNV